ncbi:hypothetical protein Tco_0238689 [Tanacetum coccineum]
MKTIAEQIALDNALVAPENQHVIGKCNMRIKPRMKPKEPTYQVVLDSLALTTYYPYSLSKLMFQSSTCISFGLPSTKTMHHIDSRSTTKDWLKKRLKECKAQTQSQILREHGYCKKISLSMEVTQLDMTSQRWSVSTVTGWDTLQGNVEGPYRKGTK